MVKNMDELLSKALVDHGLIGQGQLDGIIEDAKKDDKPLYVPLLEGGLISEDKLLNALAKELKLSFIQ